MTTTSAPTLLLLSAFAAPLLALLALATAGPLARAGSGTGALSGVWRRALAMAAPAAVLPAIALALHGGVDAEGSAVPVRLPWMLLGTTLTLDVVARPLLLITALLYGAAFSSIAWLKWRHTPDRPGTLSGYLLGAYLGNLGVLLAADTPTFYLSFAVMSLAAAGLVVHHRTDSAHRATRIYLVLTVAGETALLGAFLLVVHAGGRMIADAPAAVSQTPYAGLVVVLLLVGFGIKAGTVPLHVWLPLAHPAAPPAASAVLSGAMVKVGLVGWLRFVPPGTGGWGGDGAHGVPGGASALTAVPDVVGTAGWVLLGLALAGAFSAVVVGVLQSDPKVVLAYSTISQMGFLAAIVAVGLIEPELAPVTSAAAVLYAVHHGLAKGALFLGVPVVWHYGRGGTGVLTALGMVGAGLAVAGAPLTSGAFGKYVSKEAVSGIDVLGVGLEYILPFVATGSTLLLMRLAWLLWNSERVARRGVDGELVSWLVVAAAGIAVPWVVGARWLPLGLPDWTVSVVWNATWPIGLGIALGLVAWALASAGRLPGWVPRPGETRIQPGDLVEPEEKVLSRAGAAVVSGADGIHRVAGSGSGRVAEGISTTGERVLRAISRVDSRLGSWVGSGVATVVLLAAAVLVVVVGVVL